MTGQVVAADDLELLLAELRLSLPPEVHGIFGPDSVSWKVNRESALFLAAGRAALLQLAHPWVAAALAEHSRTLNDPVARFHQTFSVIFTMVFGTREQAIAASWHFHRRHQAIRGTLPEAAGRFAHGTPYEANQVDALRWVYATLVDSAVLAYELILPPLSDAERESYYAESLRTATLFAIGKDSLPPDWSGFRRYMETILASDTLSVSSSARSMAQALQKGAGLKVKPPFWYRALTIGLLPARLREEFQFVDGPREQAAANRALRLLRQLYPRLPAALRFVGPYNEVCARRAGRPGPSLPVRWSNQLWIGRPSVLDPTLQR
jgi:uncharacterized protein (DUF2236 family)